MEDKTEKAKSGLHGGRARYRQRLAELEEADARNRRLIEELRQSGGLFRSIADCATDAIIALDEQGRIYYMNHSAENLFGYSSAEVEGRLLHDFLVPERFRDHAQKSFEVMHEKRDRSMLGTTREFTALTRQGIELPLEISVSSCNMEDKTHYVTICRDISERKKVEEALRESEERYRRLVENLNDVVFNLDPLGRISYISPAIERVTSYKAEELVGQSFTHFIHPDDMSEVLEDFQGTLAGRLGPAEFRVLDKDGKALYVRTSSRPQYKNGELTGLTGVLTDITEQKRAERELDAYRAHLEELVEERTRELHRISEELGRSERYYRALIENSYDIIAVLDEEGTIRYLSPSMQRLSGFAAEDRLEKNVFEFLHPADLPKVMDAFSKGIKESGYSDLVEFRWQHSDGTWHWQEAIATNLTADPVVQGIVVNARDITDRKKIEDALRESEERYRTLIETSPDCIIIIDMQGKILMVNRSGLELFGYENATDMVGKSVTDFMLEEEWAKAREPMLEQVDILGAPIEFTSVRKDGTHFISESNSRLLKNAKGMPIGFISITRDVTERKQAEKTLKDSEEMYRTLVLISPSAVTMADLEGNIIYASPQTLRLHGYESEDELLGKSSLDLIVEEERDKAVSALMTVLEEGSVRNVEGTLLRKDGTRFIGELSAALIKDINGDPQSIVAYTHDITDRKRTEERVRKLNESFLSLGADPLENIQRLAITCRDILDADLVRYGRSEKEAFYVFSSLQADDGFVVREDADEFVCYYVSQAGLSGVISVEDLEERAFERDPDVRRYGLKSGLLYPVRMHDEYVGNLCVFSRESRGFTQVERDTLAMLGRAIGIEEERRAFNESLRDFVDIASHELRHPVALLAGYAETLEQHGAEMDEQTRGEVASAIRYGTDRLNRLVVGLLNISLVERERFFISKRREDLVSLVEQAVGEMRVRVPARSFNVHASEEAIESEVDPVRFHSLLIILLDNAVKYSPQNTDIDVNVEEAREEILVSVLDRGMGVSKDHRDKIFERFYQAEEAQYHSKPGLGLGLFLARQIVEAHGGRIWYEPREGGGSAFRFSLPVS